MPRVAERVLGDDSTVTDLPWAAVFDPAANVRALGAVQSQGLRAATELVDRFVKLAGADGSNGADRDGDRTASANPPGESPSATPDVDRVVATWEALMRRLAATVTAAGPVAAGTGTLDLNASGATAAVQIENQGTGPACAEVWLHNGGATDHGDVVLRCSDLLTHTGDVITADAVQFDPQPVPMPARSSRGVLATVQLDADVRPGIYRGTILVNGHPDLWLPLVLTMQPIDR
ncbi:MULTISPECIES: hypothetical protein [Mycolicibacterium]|uniref:hypothetical protein n=1 Tax=Mycolicibacterium TaxID=1866885 RepID=UPI000A7A6A49|nr:MULTISPECIES: hypothetical protein [Mycolicibacterium]